VTPPSKFTVTDDLGTRPSLAQTNRARLFADLVVVCQSRRATEPRSDPADLLSHGKLTLCG
jgi:hypothetical protein